MLKSKTTKLILLDSLLQEAERFGEALISGALAQQWSDNLS